MRNVGELLIILVSIVSIHLTFIGIDGAIQDEWSPIRPGARCGTVPVKYERGSNARAKTFPKSEDPHSHLGEGRVLHGQDARFGEWPWIVHLQFRKSGMPIICSGTLISSQWVLSAGHCGVIGRVSRWRATVGLYNIDMPDPSAVKARIDRIIVHPRYKNINNDVALFRLIKPIEYNKYIQPVCLINSKADLVSYARNKTCVALGYGRLANDKRATRLQELEIVVHKSSECVPYLGKNGQLKEGAACTGPMSDIGATCRGDSGGPNVCYNSEDDRWELFGLVSHGPKLCDRPEGDKWLTAVTDLTRYVKWIRDTVRREGESEPEPVEGDLDTVQNGEVNSEVDEY